MSSFFNDNVPGKSNKAKRNQIPKDIEDKLMKILDTHLHYVCTPVNGTATVTPSKTPVVVKNKVESVQICDLYDISQINFMNGEIPVTKLYLKSGMNANVDSQALQRMVDMIHTGLCQIFLSDYFINIYNSERGKKYECTVIETGEKKTFYDIYTGYFFYLIPRSCGLKTIAQVKAKAQEAKAQEPESKQDESPVNPSPVQNASTYDWGAKA